MRDVAVLRAVGDYTPDDAVAFKIFGGECLKKRGKRQLAAAYAVCAAPVERDGGNKGGKQEEGGSFGHIVGFGC